MMTEWVGSVCPSWYTYMSSSHNRMDGIWASRRGHVEIARLLLERGAQPNMASKVGNLQTLQCLLVTCVLVVYVGYVSDVGVV